MQPGQPRDRLITAYDADVRFDTIATAQPLRPPRAGFPTPGPIRGPWQPRLQGRQNARPQHRPRLMSPRIALLGHCLSDMPARLTPPLLPRSEVRLWDWWPG